MINDRYVSDDEPDNDDDNEIKAAEFRGFVTGVVAAVVGFVLMRWFGG